MLRKISHRFFVAVGGGTMLFVLCLGAVKVMAGEEITDLHRQLWAVLLIAGVVIAGAGAALYRRDNLPRRRMYQGRQRLGVVLALAAFVAAGCATYDPRPARVYMPPRSGGEAAGQSAAAVRQEGFPPSFLREIVAGKSVTINAPDEFRGVAIDYFRAAGAVVVESYRAHFALETRSRSENVRSGGLLRDSIRVNGSSLFGDYHVAIVELELKTAETRQLVFRGHGLAAYDQYGSWSRAVALAGRRALLNLH